MARKEATVVKPKTNSNLKKPQPRPRQQGIMGRLRSPSTRLALGGITMVVAVLLLIAFVSYLFSGDADQSVVGDAMNRPLQETGAKVQNSLGVFGAVVAHFFLFRWFGISSFLIIPLLLFLGVKLLFSRELVPLRQFTYQVIFYLFWISALFGFFVLWHDSTANWSVLSGGFGLFVNQVLYQAIGWGSAIVIGIVLFLYLIYFYRVNSLEHVAERVEKLPVPKAPKIKNPFAGALQRLVPEQEEADETPAVTEPPRHEPAFEVIKPEAVPAEEDREEQERQEDRLREDIRQMTATARRALATGVEAPAVALSVPASAVAAAPVAAPTPEAAVAEPEFTIEEVAADPLDSLIDDSFNAQDRLARLGPYDPKLELSRYQSPPLSLLKEPTGDRARVTEEELKSKKDTIVRTLSDYGITIASIKATPGPTVTLYEIVPAAGVKISRIKNLEDDIALSLAALGIRIIAPMPGKGTIGIEVPNKQRETVFIRSVLGSEKFQKSHAELPVVLGKTISNEIYVTDLARMPHLLIAGSTGQGKSVGMNVILVSLLYRKHPAELKFVLVDPKKVELSLFSKIERHFLAKLPGVEEAIITDTRKVIHTLNSLCIEMDTRYELLKNAGVRNLKEYNQKFIERRLNPEKGHRFLPYIVLVIDELADLMMTAGKEVETPIARLAQLARAIGIHLIVATQRPSVDIITGKIKANFPARLSFKVTQKVDSRTILDANGAEQLVGLGDMLFLQGSDMTRLQCPFVDTPEIDAVCDYIGGQQGYPDAYLLPEFEGDEPSEDRDLETDNLDSMFKDAARMIVTHQQGSTSLIQRKLKLGYNRAGRIMDQLEAVGIVGPFEGSKAREVLVQSDERLEEIFQGLAL